MFLSAQKQGKNMTSDSVDLFTLKTNTSKAKFTQENLIFHYSSGYFGGVIVDSGSVASILVFFFFYNIQSFSD